jgi:hypothetical protein
MCQPLLDSRFRGNERKVFGFYVPASPNCGLDGSACARLGMRPASLERRPPSTAARMPLAISTGSRAFDTAVLRSTAAQPSSMASAASEAVPMPASSTTGTAYRPARPDNFFGASFRTSPAMVSWRYSACQLRISRNPFADVKITVPKKHRLRETQAFLPGEWRINESSYGPREAYLRLRLPHLSWSAVLPCISSLFGGSCGG